MTRSTVRFLTPVACALALSLGGCVTVVDAPDDTTQSSAAESSTEEPSEEPASGGEVVAEDATGVQQDQAAALDEYVGYLQEQMPALRESFGTLYAAIDVRGVAPGTVEYVYTLASQVDPAAGSASMDQMLPTLETACETAVFPEMEAAGVTQDVKVRYTYLNADGSEIWTHLFER